MPREGGVVPDTVLSVVSKVSSAARREVMEAMCLQTRVHRRLSREGRHTSSKNLFDTKGCSSVAPPIAVTVKMIRSSQQGLDFRSVQGDDALEFSQTRCVFCIKGNGTK